jgi:hypothetical protein
MTIATTTGVGCLPDSTKLHELSTIKEPRSLRVDLDAQRIQLLGGERTLAIYPVSTALAGIGERIGSGCTPQGPHRVRIRIGDGCPVNTVFRARRPTGEVYSETLAAAHPGRDWILTRILWLTGCEPGFNRGGAVDTLRRFIYIHGCPDSEPIGVPRSHGCIRMRNTDLIALFDATPIGAPVLITGGGRAR